MLWDWAQGQSSLGHCRPRSWAAQALWGHTGALACPDVIVSEARTTGLPWSHVPSLQCCQTLVSHHVDPSLRDEDGYTAADLAEYHGHQDCAQYLRETARPVSLRVPSHPSWGEVTAPMPSPPALTDQLARKIHVYHAFAGKRFWARAEPAPQLSWLGAGTRDEPAAKTKQ